VNKSNITSLGQVKAGADQFKLAPGEKLWPETITVNDTTYSTDDLVGALDVLAAWAYQTAEAKGFFDADVDSSEMTLINLMHTEVAEITNAIRDGNPGSKKIPGYTQVEEECADVILRTLVYAKHYGHDVGPATISKALFNETRPYRFGGKPF
jgi:NTP pyrophosphatase (non-canonical NTP hydrolase)